MSTRTHEPGKVPAAAYEIPGPLNRITGSAE
jgi:hypothetical protein